MTQTVEFESHGLQEVHLNEFNGYAENRLRMSLLFSCLYQKGNGMSFLINSSEIFPSISLEAGNTSLFFLKNNEM